MGYDFSFLRFKNKPNSFPFSPDKEFKFLEEIKDVLSPKEIVKHLESKDGFIPNGKNDDGVVWYWWNTPDGGNLDIQIRPDCTAIFVDTHAHWAYVLELLKYLQLIMDDLLVLDNQTMLIYNKEAYRDFIERMQNETKNT
ncbi:hypothetical protein [Methylomarinum vadi]|uniref:hypothetical protein n=1 Tax=Methylomarinum vadi TaxID=438855 RepID=UPI0004DF6F55|nr:hypothetical protein [Methylomarinum vadi]